MRSARLLNALVIIACLAAAAFFYGKYYFKDIESRQHEELSRIFEKTADDVNQELARNRMELNESLKKIAAMNEVIEALGKEASAFKGEIEVLRKEKEDLNVKITELVEAKTILEKKFHSLKELKKAIKIAKLNQRRRSKLKRTKDRLAHIEMFKAMDAMALTQGNRGYLIKEGEMTYRPARGRIEVELEPAEKMSYIYRDTE